jgi:hypothetical protein
MYAFLLFLSVLTMAVGFFAVGFGLSPYELSLGNALIVAGAVAIVGGMILCGLALVLRQLRRIGDALGGARPVAAAPARRPQPAELGAEPPPPRPAPPPRPPYPARQDARSAPMMTELPELPPPGPERPRPNIFGIARGNDDTSDVEEPEAMPLVPTRPPAPPPMRPPVVAEPPVEPKATPADIMARLGNLATSPQRPPPRQDPRIDPRIDPRNDPRLEPPRADERAQAPDSQGSNMFDALWPADTRAARQSQPEAIARAPKPPLRPEPRPEPRMDPKLAARPEPRPEARPEPRFEPPPMTRERMEPPSPPSLPSPISQRARTEPAAASPAVEPRPIAILKSGVIDGMAYTLYTDGSIEAELPQGTMRFGSIEELRSHLENAERQD